MKRFLWCVLVWTTMGSILLIQGCATGGRPISADALGQIKQGQTTKGDIVNLLGQPAVEILSRNGSTLMYYYNHELRKEIDPGKAIKYGILGGIAGAEAFAEMSGDSLTRVTKQHIDVIWVLIAANNKVSNALQISDYLEEILAAEDGPSLFGGYPRAVHPQYFFPPLHIGFHIHFVSDPPGAKIELSNGSGFHPVTGMTAVEGNSPYTPLVFKFTKLPTVSELKNWRVRVVWENTGR